MASGRCVPDLTEQGTSGLGCSDGTSKQRPEGRGGTDQWEEVKTEDSGMGGEDPM